MSFIPSNIDYRAANLVATFLSSKGAATRQAYGMDILCFQEFLRRNLKIDSTQSLLSLPAGELNFIVLKYRDCLVEKSFSPSTVNRRLGAIRSLFKLARLLGLTNSKLEIPNLKSEAYRDTKGPGLPAFKRMKDFAATQSVKKATRDNAILRLLFDLALRASEVVELDLAHIDLEQRRVSIKGKGRTQREYLSLPSTSIEALKNWIQFRGSDAGPLFVNLVRDIPDRKRLSRTGLFKLIRWLGQKAQVKTRPHGIRHLSITEACKAAQNNGFALEEVMDHSRHKSIATLMIYRDRERDAQGAISTLVSNTIHEQED